MRERRLLLRMTQQQLGEKTGVTYQQIQKYETGTSRISASRMWAIAAALEVPVSFFFEGLDGQAPDMGKVRGDPFTDKEALELVCAYSVLPKNQRRRLFDLACALGEAA
jgi:transcriptional regulator with XRE-family HTH domain